MGPHADKSQIYDSEKVCTIGTLFPKLTSNLHPASMKWGTEWGKCVNLLSETANETALKRSYETLAMNQAELYLAQL